MNLSVERAHVVPRLGEPELPDRQEKQRIERETRGRSGHRAQNERGAAESECRRRPNEQCGDPERDGDTGQTPELTTHDRDRHVDHDTGQSQRDE